MIVCSCNYITDKEIHDAVDGLMLANPIQVLTPGKVYKSIGSRPNCGSCLSHAADLIHKRAACLRGCHECACEVEFGQSEDAAVERQEEKDNQIRVLSV
ncbi:MAG: (2Fe-2S)-binding protein [Pseudomonadota bacterium]